MRTSITKQEIADEILDIFEDLLAEKGIIIPCASQSEEEDRQETEDAANLYGSEYYDLEEKIVEILNEV